MKFEKGRSGNPGGMTKEQREIRKSVAAKLDEASISEDGRDKLVDAIMRGVEDGDGSCIKIAAEYRWGKPLQPVSVEGDVATFTVEQLLAQLPEAVASLKGAK